MRRAILLAVIAMSVPAAATDEGAEAFTYEIAAVEGKLYLVADPEETRLSSGDEAVSGDRLRTGSSSSATIGVPTHNTGFRLGAKTSCTLAHDRPGVLMHLERGRLRALFGSFTGNDPRLVTTPSAVLAVRGTEYGLKVKKNGDTRIVVFQGTVEVTDPAGEKPPVLVEAGQQSRIRTGRDVEPPKPHRLTPDAWDRGYSSSPPQMSGGGPGPNGPSGPPGVGSNENQSGSRRHGG